MDLANLSETYGCDERVLRYLFGTHSYPLSIDYEDTDFTGNVFHGHYLRYFGRARSELIGTHNLRALLDECGVGFVVYRAELHFRRPVAFGGRIRIETTPRLTSRYKLDFAQRAIEGGGAVSCTASVRVVCTNVHGRPVPIPLREIAERAAPRTWSS